MEVAWPWLVGREGGREVSENGDREPLPGRRADSLSWLPGSRGWCLAKEVGSWVVGQPQVGGGRGSPAPEEGFPALPGF